MLNALTLLVSCQFAGEIAARGLGLPIPGPVVGLLLLLVYLLVRGGPSEPLRATATGLLANLGLLFVPAGVGVVQYLGLIGEYGVALAVALVGSTLLTLLATVGAFLAVKRLLNGREA